MPSSLVQEYLLSALLCNLPLVTEEFRCHRVLWEANFSVAARSLLPGCPTGRERGGRRTENPQHGCLFRLQIRLSCVLLLPLLFHVNYNEGPSVPFLCQPDSLWAGGREGFVNRGHSPARPQARTPAQ